MCKGTNDKINYITEQKKYTLKRYIDNLIGVANALSCTHADYKIVY